MKNKLKSVRMGSKSAASPQSKDRGNPVNSEMARVVGNKSEDVAVAGPGADSERADGLESNRECRYEIYEDGMLLSYAALAVIQDLQDAYWDSVDKEDYLENSLAEGRIFLSLHVMDKLQKHAKLIRVEYEADLQARRSNAQQRAA